MRGFVLLFPNRHSLSGWVRTAKLIYFIFSPHPIPIHSLIKLAMIESRKLEDGRSLRNHLDQAPFYNKENLRYKERRNNLE